MSDNAVIARPYAKAIFAIAKADSSLAKWSEILAALAAVTCDPDIRNFLADPRVNWQQRSALFIDGCSKILDQHGQNFIRMLALKRRLPFLPAIFELYQKLVAEHEGVQKAEIITAFAIDKAQQQKLVEVLQKRFQANIVAHYSEDKSLLGGVLVRMGDRVLDGSVRSKLDKLRKNLIT
ncbi:MAG: F0F1 ATP synthase subunit delta [Gammaproteobacteria bacterium]|nr:F0F1 ATP synthase subunit delta [Gammaproteobacteria bacterium]